MGVFINQEQNRGVSSISQEALQAQPLLSSSPVPAPGGPHMEVGYQRYPWSEQCSDPRGQAEEGKDAAPVPD